MMGGYVCVDAPAAAAGTLEEDWDSGGDEEWQEFQAGQPTFDPASGRFSLVREAPVESGRGSLESSLEDLPRLASMLFYI